MQIAPVSANGVTTADIAMRYFDAWNNHDPSAIVATFAEGGTYSDPSVGTLTGPAIGEYATGLFEAFADLSFDLVNVTTAANGDVLAEWVMRGTNTGQWAGAPPTGETLALPGVDVVTFIGALISSVRGYFDQKSFIEQSGLQAVVMPKAIGPFTFGVAVYARRDARTTPGAFSVTSISACSDEEVAQIDNLSFEIVSELMETPGFLSFAGVTIGHRGLTITAWEDAEHAGGLRRQGPHREAMAKFFGSGWASGGFTSVWVPERINTLWMRCAACDTPLDAHKANGVCSCGATLPEPPPYF